MKKAVVFVFLFSAVSVFAQVPAKALKTFDSGGLKFSYPPDWNIADQSTSDIQNILLSKKGTNVLISLISPLASPGSQEDYERMQNVINTLYIDSIHEGLATRLDPPRQEGTCLSLNGRDISGNRYIGVYNNEPSSGEIYPYSFRQQVHYRDLSAN